MEVEIGIGKTGRRAYGFDDIAIVPSRRTRDPEDVDISWEVDAYKFELPMMAAAMDGVVSPQTAIEVGRLGGLACGLRAVGVARAQLPHQHAEQDSDDQDDAVEHAGDDTDNDGRPQHDGGAVRQEERVAFGLHRNAHR